MLLLPIIYQTVKKFLETVLKVPDSQATRRGNSCRTWRTPTGAGRGTRRHFGEPKALASVPESFAEFAGGIYGLRHAPWGTPPSASRLVEALDLDQLPAGALDHQPNHLVTLLYYLDVGSGRRRLHNTRDLNGGMVAVGGAQGLGLDGFSAL